MNKQQVKQYIENNPKEGDPLIGFFLALTQPNYWLILSITGVILIGELFIGLSQAFSLPSVAFIAIIGGCSLFSRKTCFIAVTKSGVLCIRSISLASSKRLSISHLLTLKACKSVKVSFEDHCNLH